MAVLLAICADPNKASELLALAKDYSLFLKPIARISLTVQLPTLHDSSGQVKSFTTWEIIEKLRQLCPGILSPSIPIRVVRTTLEFVRLIAEVQCKADVKRVVTSLDSQYIKLSGFPQNLHVRACEAPVDCPRRHDWEAFFRDADNMDETKPGERPDTLVLSGLPVRWFAQPIKNSQPSGTKESNHSSFANRDQPNPAIVQSVFEYYGAIRRIDIPMLDPTQNPNLLEASLEKVKRVDNNGNSQTPDEAESTLLSQVEEEKVGGFGKIGPDTIAVSGNVSSLAQASDRVLDVALGPVDWNSHLQNAHVVAPLTFMSYIQYMDYTGFIKAMEGLRAKKLVYAPSPCDVTVRKTDQEEQLHFSAEIKVDFDRTKYLSRAAVCARKLEAQHLTIAARRRHEEARAFLKAEEEQRRLIETAKRKTEERRRAEMLAKEAEKMAKREARLERKKQQAIERCKQEKDSLVREKIMLDEKRRLLAIRKVEAIRLMTFILNRIQTRHDQIVTKRQNMRLARAERDAAEAEASAERVYSIHRIDRKKTELFISTPSLDCVSESSSSVQTNSEASPMQPMQQDVLLNEILKRREANLRAQLLKKHVSQVSNGRLSQRHVIQTRNLHHDKRMRSRVALKITVNRTRRH